MTVKPYDEYKTSDSRFLRKIPVHWDESPLKWHIQRNDGGAWGEDPRGGEHDVVVLRSTEQTVDGTWCIEEPAKRSLSESEREATLLTEGDLLITKSSGSSLHIGKTTLVTSDVAGLGCCYSNFMQRLRPGSSLEPKLGWYLLNNKLSRDQLNLLSSSTTGLANINATTIGRIYVPVPPKGEQVSILRFLDRETAKIDALIAEQQRLIELLQEKRQAVISHAVTKGLNPNSPIKDSGVEWLGDVPEHWTICPLKHFCKITTGFAFKSDEFQAEGIPLVRISDIQSDGTIDLKDAKNLKESELIDHARETLKHGDIAMAMTGGTIGKAGIYYSDQPALLNQRVCIFRAKPDCSQAFLWFITASRFYQEHIKLSSFGGAQPNISDGDLLACICPMPPLAEQEMISAFIDSKAAKLGELQREAESTIELLNERRSALISAAVTGQIDVRGLVEGEGSEQ